jgi:hypothetical protein
MKNHRPQEQRFSLMRRYTVGEDPKIEGSRGKEKGLSWNGPISPTIRGGEKKANYSYLPVGDAGGMPGSFVALLDRRGSRSMRSGGSHSSLGKGSGLVMSLGSRGTRGGPIGPH